MVSPVTAAGQFLQSLYPNATGHLNICVLDPQTDRLTSNWFPVTDLHRAAEFAVTQNREGNSVWYQTGLTGEDLGPHRKGREAEIIAVPALHVDLDVSHPDAHKSTDLPPSTDDALSLLDGMLPPTYIVSSGYGLQAYWLFDAPQAVTDDNRATIKSLLTRWQARIQQAGKSRGWKVDGTANLDRLLRPIGTFNLKVPSSPKPVTVLGGRIDGPRYSVAELLADLPPEPEPVEEIDWSEVETSTVLSSTIQTPSNMADETIIERAKSAKNGEKFQRLMKGDASNYGDNRSDAVQGLLCLLAFWSRDPNQIERIAGRSKLCEGYEKWNRPKWRDESIRKALETVTEFHKGQEQKPSSPKRRLNIRYGTKPDSAVIEPPTIIEGLLRRGEVANLVSSPKMRKSWAIHDLCHSVTHGLKWFDRFTCQPSRVLLIDNELREWQLRERITKIRAAKGITSEEDFGFVALRDDGGMTLGDLMTIMEDEADKFDLIVLDALYRFFPDDFEENSNGDMTRLYNQLDTLARRSGAAIVIVHHTSKGDQQGKATTDAGSGAGAQSRAADAHIVLRAVTPVGSPQDDAPDRATLTAVVRSFKPIDKVHLQWDFPFWRLATPDENKVAEKRKSVEEYADTYGREVWESRATIEDRARHDGWSKRDSQDFFDGAVAENKMEMKAIKQGRQTLKQYRKLTDLRPF